MKINIGGAKNHPKVPGWTVIDLRNSADIVLDISKNRLPFEDSSVDIVFSSHTLEHIYPNNLDFVLKEIYRVTKTGGLVRIAVPDIRKAIAAYVNNDLDWFSRTGFTYHDKAAPIGGLLASWFYSISTVGNGHVHCFDFEYMTYQLQKAGFQRVEQSEYQKSSMEELRSSAFDRFPMETLFVETWK